MNRCWSCWQRSRRYSGRRPRAWGNSGRVHHHRRRPAGWTISIGIILGQQRTREPAEHRRAEARTRHHVAGTGDNFITSHGQMDGPAGGSVARDASWHVLDRSGNQVAARLSRLSEPAGTGTTAAAMSRTLGVLSHDIARELKATERGLR